MFDVPTDNVVSIALSLFVCCNNQSISQTPILSVFDGKVAPSEELVRVLLGLDAKEEEEEGEEDTDSDNNANTCTAMLIVGSKERTMLNLA